MESLGKKYPQGVCFCWLKFPTCHQHAEKKKKKKKKKRTAPQQQLCPSVSQSAARSPLTVVPSSLGGGSSHDWPRATPLCYRRLVHHFPNPSKVPVKRFLRRILIPGNKEDFHRRPHKGWGGGDGGCGGCGGGVGGVGGLSVRGEEGSRPARCGACTRASCRRKPGPHSAGRDERYLVFTPLLPPLCVRVSRAPLKRVRIIWGRHVPQHGQIGGTSGATSVDGVMTSLVGLLA